MACDTIKIETLDADEVVSIVTQGPQGPSGAEAATLTTTGDLLYRAALANDRLPIGSEGQILKVSSGLPAWGNESGAVTEVNGQTGAVTLTASDVGAQSLFSQISAEITEDYVVSSSRALILFVRNLYQNEANIRLPLESASLAGDVIVVANSPTSLYQTLNIQSFLVGPSIWVTINTINRGEQKRFILSSSGAWSLVSVDTHTHAAAAITNGTLDIARIPTGTGSTQVALGNHTHAQLHDKSHTMTDATSHTAGNHKVFYSNGSGEIVELALGNSGEVLTSNGATSAPSFAAASGGVTAVGASTADVLSVSGSDLVADDGGTIDSADPFIKWDDTAGKLVYANPLSRPSGAFYVGLAPTTTALGSNAINVQATRSNAADVASGSASICIGTGSIRASGNESIAMGVGSFVNASRAVGIGFAPLASGVASVCITGLVDVASGVNSAGINGSANLRAQFATRPFSAIYWSGQTTDNTATILNLDGTATNRFTIAANTALAVDILLVARRLDTADKWLVARRFLGIRRDGSNNTSLIGSVQTLGTDQSEGSPSWTFALTADDTNEALQLEVTGAASETVQWRATAFYRAV